MKKQPQPSRNTPQPISSSRREVKAERLTTVRGGATGTGNKIWQDDWLAPV